MPATDAPRPRGRGWFLLPATGVMNRLKYPQKFLLISLLGSDAMLEWAWRIPFWKMSV